MKNVISVAALVAALATGSAFAADLPSHKEAPVFVAPPAFSWTGLYGGVNIGGGWTERGNSNGGVGGGGQLGYNFQLSPLLVVGLETDFQGTSIGNHNGGPRPNLPWFGTVRGRAGFALLDSKLFVYGTGGFAYGEVTTRRSNDTRTGWTAGGGLEYAFLPNWSAKVEYLRTELTSDNWGWNGPRRTQFNTVRVGVNYHFNLFAPAPVVAKY